MFRFPTVLFNDRSSIVDRASTISKLSSFNLDLHIRACRTLWPTGYDGHVSVSRSVNKLGFQYTDQLRTQSKWHCAHRASTPKPMHRLLFLPTHTRVSSKMHLTASPNRAFSILDSPAIRIVPIVCWPPAVKFTRVDRPWPYCKSDMSAVIYLDRDSVCCHGKSTQR